MSVRDDAQRGRARGRVRRRDAVLALGRTARIIVGRHVRPPAAAAAPSRRHIHGWFSRRRRRSEEIHRVPREGRAEELLIIGAMVVELLGNGRRRPVDGVHRAVVPHPRDVAPPRRAGRDADERVARPVARLARTRERHGRRRVRALGHHRDGDAGRPQRAAELVRGGSVVEEDVGDVVARRRRPPPTRAQRSVRGALPGRAVDVLVEGASIIVAVVG
mmetsp:Transcript_17906/g.71779  ORF Transcript_17906/g.71779 Transcript_17906/m.71779 type:complete len:218 (-) Transcript_17906:319-972(-)